MARDVTFNIIGRDHASKAFGSVGSAADKTGGKLGKLGGAAKAGAVGLAGLAVGAAATGIKLFGAAVNVEAMGNKAKTVFGRDFPAAKKKAEELSVALGMSTTETLALTAGFGDLLTPMGFSTGKAQQMSGEIGTLTAALSQWSGGTKSAADVGDMLSDALTGEYDSLKSLGVQIDADLIKQRLHEQGKDKLTGAARKQAEAEIALKEITAQSSNALNGYNAKTNKLGLAKQRLTSQIKNLRDGLASALLPALAKAATWLGDKLPGAIDWLKDTWKSFSTAFTTKDPFGRFTDGAFKVQRAGYLVRVIFDKVSTGVKLLAGWFTGTLMPAIRSTVATVMPMFRLALENVRKALGSAGKAGGDWGTRLHALGQVVKVVLQAVIFAVAAFAVIWSAQMRIVAGVVNKVVIPAVRLIWTVFSRQVGLILDGAARAFGWVPGLGPKLKKAAADFARFAAATNRALAGIKNKQVTITIRKNTIDYSNGVTRSRSKNSPNLMRAHGGGLAVGMAYSVNEQGQEMLRLTDRSAAVIPHAQSQRMLRSAGDGGNVYNFYLSGMYGNRQQLARDIRAIMAEARGSGALAGA